MSKNILRYVKYAMSVLAVSLAVFVALTAALYLRQPGRDFPTMVVLAARSGDRATREIK